MNPAAALRVGARRKLLLQLALVTLIIASFIWIGRHAFRGSTEIFAIVLLAALAWSHRRRGDSFRDLGFRSDTMRRTALLFAPVAIGSIAIALAVGTWMQSLRFPPIDVAIRTLAKLLVFGIAQQYVLLGFYYRGFAGIVRSSGIALLLTALVFAAFHIPNVFLMSVTFCAAVIATAVYRHSPNLWVNGLTHGLVSFVLYYSLPHALTHNLRVGPEY
jgi:membrane protease YdiL (CAAX protease family)